MRPGTDILTSPVRVYKDRVAVYFFDGRVQCDIIAPAGPERDAVLALVGQAQRAFKLLAGASGRGHEPARDGSGRYSCDHCATFAPHHTDGCGLAKVLRDAGVLGD